MRQLFTASVFILFLTLVMSWRDAIPVQTYLVQTELAAEDFERIARRGLSDVTVTEIYSDLGIFKVTTRTSHAESMKRIDQWRTSGICIVGHPDRKIQLRNSPDDPLWPEQWGHIRIGIETSWETMTGGISATGDTIVVAVLDAGFNLEHVDLKANLWHNFEEIPGDGIDNDLNGYIDDFTGLNIQEGNDDHPIDIHGTEVAGILGASGNNNKGITGINWNVKILPISGINFESDVIEGYNYIKKWREQYNSSGGQQGAFIVVTNLSAGIDGAWAPDYPMWCAVYDDLGQVGVLSTSAVTNRESLVDVEGDMPTTCTSDFLITVTNTDMDDRKFSPAGFGRTHVDLGAPGTPTLTTGLGNEYSTFGSTSAACPHVAGTIALMYSTACEQVMTIAIDNPEEAARRMRALVLNTVDKNTALEDKTASGGRLDAGQATAELCEAFDDSVDDISVERIFPNPTQGDASIEVLTPLLEEHTLRIFDSTGRLVVDRTFVPASNYFIEDISITAGPGVFYLLLEVGGRKTTDIFVVI